MSVPTKRERELAERFINRIGPTANWTDAIATQLADYRVELLTDVVSLAQSHIERLTKDLVADLDKKVAK